MMNFRRAPSLLMALIFIVGTQALAAEPEPGANRRAALQAACYPEQSLRAIVGEKPPVKGLHTFDKPPSDTSPLAAFAAVPPNERGVIRRVELPAGEKLVAITFDLCEQRGEIAGYDGDLFDYLRREKVSATLFAGGKWLRSHPARTEQLLSDPLFEIANHGENHRNLRLLDAPNITSEIIGPQRAYERARRGLAATQCAQAVPDAISTVPERMTLLRFPFGACHAQSIAAVNDAGLRAIQWDVSAGDPDPHQSSAAIARTVLARVKPGSIIVAHGNGRGFNTAAALPLIVPKLRALGYRFVTVSELLKRGRPVVADSCYDARPGDTDRYDFLAGGKTKPTTTGSWSPTQAVTGSDKAATQPARKSLPQKSGASSAPSSYPWSN
jgi:peptidoglycan-N-acetylglucosamine deacetylase